MRKAAVGSRAVLGNCLGDGAARFGDALERAVEQKKISRIDISGQSGLVALQHLPFRVFGNAEDGEDFASRKRGMRVRERIGAHGDRDGLIGVQGLDQIAAHFGVILINDRNRDLAQELAEIGLRIKDAVEDRRHHDQPEDATVVEDATHFREHRIPEADARKGRGGRRLGDASRRSPADGAEAQPGEPEEYGGKRAQDDERFRGARRRQSAHSLVEQNLDVPAQRQQRAPEVREGVHCQQRKADARKAKGRIAEDGGEAQAGRELARQKLQQAPERKIGDD